MLKNEWIDARRRLYAWLSDKALADGPNSEMLPKIEELDDNSLIDLAYATAGL